jgi:hypothetical protein
MNTEMKSELWFHSKHFSQQNGFPQTVHKMGTTKSNTWQNLITKFIYNSPVYKNCRKMFHILVSTTATWCLEHAELWHNQHSSSYTSTAIWKWLKHIKSYLILFSRCLKKSCFPRISQPFPFLSADHPFHMEICLVAYQNNRDTAKY